MRPQARTANYNFEGAPTKSAADAVDPGVQEFLQRLARAIQQFHTYPATSPLCQHAVEAALRALQALGHRDLIAFRVGPRALIVDDAPIGQGGLVGHELARRLHATSIAEVTIDGAAAERELARFCIDLVARDDRRQRGVSLIETLAEHGVRRIALRAAYQPEILEASTPDAATIGLVQQQQHRREELLATVGGTVNHLYPPDKGWVRLDPASPLRTVSLADLPLLAEDPAALAAMLLRLTDGESMEGMTNEDALAQKFSDVTRLFSALDPRVARVMFSRLSRAVLDLAPERRQALLRRTILPGLLDGRMEGGVLRDFPDLELAESLCLLLDLETAAPEVVTTAFARLELAPERQGAVMPLLEHRMRERQGASRRDTTVDAHARKLLHVDRAKARSFAEFAAFDLALDAHAKDVLQDVRDGVATSDGTTVQLECLWSLIRLEPNPDAVQRFFDRAAVLLESLEHGECWARVADWLARCRVLTKAIAPTRPDVADAIGAKLSALCIPDRAARLVSLAARDDRGRQTANAIVAALGPAIAAALLSLAQVHPRDREATRKSAMALLTDNAVLVAPALAAAVTSGDGETTRIIVRVLGAAGRGYEDVVGARLASGDEQTVREALRSLARMATSKAAAIVAAEVEKNRGWVGLAAEETLWRFPAAEAHRHVTSLLGRREFVLRQPQLASRLFDRAAHAGTAGLKPIATALVPLRYRIWNRAAMRLGRKARALAAS